MPSFLTKAQLYTGVAALRASYGFTLQSYPINPVYLAAQRAQVSFFSFSTPGLCGVAKVGSVQDSIALNARRSRAEQRFDCGHEMLHLFLHRDITGGTFACTSSTAAQNPVLEWQANAGSAELLVPWQLFLPLVAQNRADCATPQGYRLFRQYLASYFGTTIPVISNRFEDLKFELHQYLTGTPLVEIEILSAQRQHLRNIAVSSFNQLHGVNPAGITAPIGQKRPDNPYFLR